MRGRTIGLLLLLLLLAVPAVGWLAIRSIDGGYVQRVIAQRVEAATGRRLTIAGPATVSWSMTPTLTVDGLSLANAPGGAAPALARIGRLELQLHLWSLLGGHPEVDRLALHRVELDLERDAAGVGNWVLQPAAATPAAGPPAQGGTVPVVREALIEDGAIRYRSPDTGEVTTIAIERGRLTGLGTSDSAQVEVMGSLDEVPASLAGRLAKAGDVLTGDLQRADLSDLRVRLGDSLLTGSATLDWAPAQSVLRADLASERLDLATFLDLQGAGGAAEQDEPTLDGLSVLDADVRLRADSMLVRGLELQLVEATAELRSGKLEVEPLAFDLFGSPVRGALTMDGAAAPNRVALDASSEALDIGRLLSGLGASELVEGRGEMRLAVQASGPTPQAWRADATGHLRFLMGEGRLRSQLVDQLAGGLRELLATLGGGKGDAAAVRCAALDMPLAKGVAHPDLILDTDYSTLVAHGTVDLAHDRLDLVLSPQAKSLDLNLALPVTVRGPIADPSFGLDEGDAARRLASLLGSAIFPPAAIGAFVDFGSAGSNGCLALASKPAPGPASPAGGVLDAVKRGVEDVSEGLKDLLTPNP